MSKSEDAKIMAFVATVIVLGMVGIAVVAGLAGREEVAVARPHDSPIEPASLQRELPGTPAPVIETTALTALEPAPIEPFRVAPGEDYVQRGLELFRTRDFEKSAAYFRAEANERPDRGWTHYMLGLSLWKSAALDDAARAMERAIELSPEHIRAFVNLSRIHNDRGEFAEALEVARAALRLDPEHPAALFLEGRSLHNLGRREEALTSLSASLEIDPDNGYVHNLVGLTLIQLDRTDEALEPLARAAELEPQVAFIQNNLGMALEHNGMRPEALSAYRRAVELGGGSERAAQNLARLEAAGVGTETVVSEADDDAVVVARSSADPGPAEERVEADPEQDKNDRDLLP